jgi:multidrug efflux pump
MPNGSDLQLSDQRPGPPETEEEFGDIVVKTGADGAVTRLRDIARLELAAAATIRCARCSTTTRGGHGHLPGAGLQRARHLATNVRAKMDESRRTLPKGVEYRIVYDPPVRARVDQVGGPPRCSKPSLVVLVVILFLQTWRASIIPLLAVPVSVVGTFAVLHLLRLLDQHADLFGLVLAIGIVVDDAIVVVENVERNIEARA